MFSGRSEVTVSPIACRSVSPTFPRKVMLAKCGYFMMPPRLRLSFLVARTDTYITGRAPPVSEATGRRHIGAAALV
jgi:hypothetical protein